MLQEIKPITPFGIRRCGDGRPHNKLKKNTSFIMKSVVPTTRRSNCRANYLENLNCYNISIIAKMIDARSDRNL